MFRLLRVLTDRFVSNERGTLAVVFALAVVPVMLAAGAAIDYSRAVNLRNRLQSVTDSTALATARYITSNPSASDSDVNRFAGTFFTSAFRPDLGSLDPINFEKGRTRLSLTARATYHTMIMKAASVGQTGSIMADVPITATAAVDRGTGFLEIALVLDNTGSMATNNRIGRLRDAATKLVTILEGARTVDRDVKISLVPFVTAVNVKGTGYKSSWIDLDAKAKYHGQNFVAGAGGTKVNHMDLFAKLRDASGNPVAWKGCVEARPEPYDIDDTSPSGSTPDTLFVPWFWPDEPDYDDKGNTPSGYTNNYLNDQFSKSSKTGVDTRQRSIAKYVTTNKATIDEVPSDTLGPNKSCPTPIVPLTGDFNLLRTQIAAMREWGNSGTNIAEGLAWGERVLSPAEPYTDGKPWEQANVQKVVILLTDGENLVFGQNQQTTGGATTHNKSDYSSVGYMAEKRVGTDSPNVAKDKILARMNKACQRLKEKMPNSDKEKATVYTITFELSSTSLQTAFRNCASRPDMYYESPNGDKLQQVFEAIAWELASLRIAK